MQPETRYAKSGDVHIAYQVTGDGPIDLVWVAGSVSHLENDWEEPSRSRFFRRLASFARLIRFDKRGTGLSDRVSVSELPTLEQRMDDVRAVMDAVGSERAALGRHAWPPVGVKLPISAERWGRAVVPSDDAADCQRIGCEAAAASASATSDRRPLRATGRPAAWPFAPRLLADLCALARPGRDGLSRVLAP